eukprot:scaffold106232_cov114-Phaeocystis_antarctica.AAC.3
MEARCMRHHYICLENAEWCPVAVNLRRTPTVFSRSFISFSRVSTVYATGDRVRVGRGGLCVQCMGADAP